jgi:hypothetical protein
MGASKSAGNSDNKTTPTGLAVPPDETNEREDVTKWLGVTNSTEIWRNNLGDKAGWNRFLSEFQCDWSLLEQSIDITLIPINLVYAYVKTEVSRLYFRDPWISVNAKRMEDLGASHIAEQLINYMWGEIDLKRQIKLAIMDALIVGHGWIKLGYTAEFGTVESKIPAKRGVGRPKKDDPDLDSNEFVKSENVFAYHQPHDQVIFDPSASWPPTHNARWMAFKSIKPLSVVRDCGLYKKSAVAELKPSELPAQDRNTYTAEGEWVAIYEIWDKENKVVKTISPGCPMYLKEPMPWPYKFEGFPAVMFSFNPVPGKPYPLSDIAPWEGQVVELMKMHSIMINHLKRWNRQVMIKAGMMTDEEKAKFKNSVDGGIVEYQGNKEDLFIPPYAAVQQDVYGVWNLTMDMFRNVAGQSEVDRGGAAKAQTRTLGELRLTLQGSKNRSDEKVDMIEESIEELARKLLSIMQQKFDLPKIIRVVGNRAVKKAEIAQRPSAQGANAQLAYTGKEVDGEIQSFSATKDDIHGEMDVSCVAGSTIPLNKENQLEIMEKLTPSLELVGIKPGSRAAREYGREILRLINILSLDRIMDVAEEEAQTNQTPDPKMLELQAKMQSEAAKGQMDMQIAQQKGQIEVQKMVQQLKVDQQKAMLDLKAVEAKTQAVVIKAEADKKKTEMEIQRSLIESLLGGPSQNGAKKESSNGDGPHE